MRLTLTYMTEIGACTIVADGVPRERAEAIASSHCRMDGNLAAVTEESPTFDLARHAAQRRVIAFPKQAIR
jgi:hypothetical protein